MPRAAGEEAVRVVALDRSFHVECYKCEDCGVILYGEEDAGCYPLDDHVLCKNCNTKRIHVLTNDMGKDQKREEEVERRLQEEFKDIDVEDLESSDDSDDEPPFRMQNQVQSLQIVVCDRVCGAFQKLMLSSQNK